MTTLGSLTQRLLSKEDLDGAAVEFAAAALAGDAESQADKEAFLVALAEKGESVSEVADFARAFRKRALNPGVERWSSEAIDIVGTGGDHAGGFNISSLVTLTLACAGVKAMKHGNRGITSKCGSADLIAAFGYQLEASPEVLQRALAELGYVFFFAPAYHPAFKNVGPVRRALAARGQRTVFNILGPLINPGRPAHVILGSFSEAWVPKLAAALHELGATAGLAAHGRTGPGKGIDELTTATPNRVKGFGRIQSIDTEWSAADFGLTPAPFSDLLGGDLAANLGIAENVVQGRGPKGLEDTIVLNTAVALWVCGRTASVQEGLEPSRALLTGGAVSRKIRETKEFFHS